jgi:sugar phosphate isomerase/epimerase
MKRKMMLRRAAAGLAAALAIPLLAVETPAIRLGVCDWTIGKSGDPGALEMAGRLGLEGVQVSLAVKNGDLALRQPELRRAYAEAAAKTGVAVASFCLGDLNDVPLKSDSRAEKWLGQSLEIAPAMKVSVVLVPFFGKGDIKNDPAGIDAVVGVLQRLAPRAEKAGVVFGLEDWLSAADNLKIIERVGSPSVRVYYDVGNSADAGYDILKEIRALGPRICEFHAKDTKGLYGKGKMDFAAVREAMSAIGYRGWFVLEGTEMPLGIEKSVRFDTDYLRTLFPRK